VIFTFETYSAANRRMLKRIGKAERQARISPMAVDRLYRLEHIHDLILQRFNRERDPFGKL
jgi:hypothetical protein